MDIVGYEDFTAKLDKYRVDYKVQESKVAQDKALLDQYERDILSDEHKSEVLDEVVMLFKRLSSDQTTSAITILEGVINNALANIDLKQNYQLQILEGTSAKISELNFKLIDQDTGKERSIRRQTGKGISQIVSVLALLIVLKFANKSKFIILDEQLSGLQDEATIRMFSEVLTSIAKNEGFQIIMVEHKSEIDQVDSINTLYLDLPKDDASNGLRLVNTKHAVYEAEA